MFANVALSEHGLFGETTSLIDRCIFESCVKVLWLCRQANPDEAFGRYFADGLKADLALRDEISESVAARGGDVLRIEKRMLESIDRYIATTGMTAETILSTKKLPDLSTMVKQVGWDNLEYVVAEKIGSHHVHGTWSGLLASYLERDEDGSFHPRDHDAPTHVNQYVFISLRVLAALKGFCVFVMKTEGDARTWCNLLSSIEDEILKVNAEIVGTDFEVAE